MSASGRRIQKTFDWEHVCCWLLACSVVGVPTLRETGNALVFGLRWGFGVWWVGGFLYYRYYDITPGHGLRLIESGRRG
jgi:hypothetical protein